MDLDGTDLLGCGFTTVELTTRLVYELIRSAGMMGASEG
jgi:hypothetical protein